MYPISEEQFDSAIVRTGIIDQGTATIRQIGALAAHIEQQAGEPMVRLQIGNPGLEACRAGVEAEIEALRQGVASEYPNIAGISRFKEAGSRFLKAFFDTDIAPGYIIPTVGSMQGSLSVMMLLGQAVPGRDTILFLNPGFSAQRHQAIMLGLKVESLDIYGHRGDKLLPALEAKMSRPDIAAVIYNSPNNPAWTNLTDDELRTIGQLATRYGVTVIEDQAYCGMDFRTDYGVPFAAPYIPTVARYTHNYILLLSCSKIFSYAGQRIAMVAFSPRLYAAYCPHVCDKYEMPCLGDCYVYAILYCCSSGTSHSAQHAAAAMMEASVDGRYNFVEVSAEYARRCVMAKEIFARHGFHLVYADDDGVLVSDGFFFTAGYGSMQSTELQGALLRHGIATMALTGTGSTRQGLRICVSMLTDERARLLDERLDAFEAEYSYRLEPELAEA